MKRILWLFLIFPCSPVFAQGPGFEWAVRTGAAGASSIGQSVDVDAAGNVYAAGRFTGTVDFDPGAGVVNHTSAGSEDAFITKMDLSGNLIWAKRVGGTQGDYIFGNAVDGTGNVYLTGSFAGTVDFDPGPGVFNLTAPGGFIDDIFILKLDPDGNFLWAKRIGASGLDFGHSIAVGPTGVVTTGSFEGTVDFDPGAGTASLVAPAGQDEIFILKLDASGNYVWAKRMGGSNGDFGRSIALDASESVYSTGFFRGTADFDPGPATFNLTDAGNSDIFVSKLDASGNFVWAKRMGGTNSDGGYGIKVDIGGNVYTTGDFHGTADFDPGAGTSNLVSAGFNDSFVSKLDAFGNFVWAKRIGGNSDDEGSSLGLDGGGNVYIAGSFESSTIDLDPGPGTFNVTPVGSGDVFITKLDPSGNFAWGIAFGASRLNSIHVNAVGRLYTTGYFSNTVDFDPGAGVTNLTAAGTRDIFISKLSQSLIPPTVASFTPGSGPVGTSVTINGTNFSSEPDYNIVYFGATRASVTAATSTQLTVAVPIGATWQPISVTVSGLTAFSQKPFVLTFPNGGVIDGCALLTPPQYFNGAIHTYGLDVADLDGDGKVDAVTSSNSIDAILIFRNNSTPGTIDASTFESPVQLAVGRDPQAVKLADMDGDGKLDIVVTSGLDNIVSIFRNISTAGSLTAGSFAPRFDYATGGPGPWRIVCQDLDLDGRTDLAVANNPGNTIGILRNTGTPGVIDATTFAPVFTIVGPGSLTAFEVADFDVDGRPDFMVGHSIGTQMGIIRNISSPGSLSAASFATRVDFAAGNWLSYTAVGDLDNDNRPDVITVSGPSATFSIHKNTSTPGTINASSFAPQVVYPSSDVEPTDVTISDMDGDGKPDIVLGNFVPSKVVIYKNVSAAGVLDATSFSPGVAFSGAGNPTNLLTTDIDGDGRSDVINTHWNGPELVVFRNTVSATPNVTGFAPVYGNVGSTVAITGSFAGAATDNIVYFGATRATVVSATPTELQVTVPNGTTYAPVSVMSGCKTEYAKHPFVATFSGGGTIAAGSFAAKVDFSTGAFSRPADVELADLDRDGLADAMTINDQNNGVSVFRNTSSFGAISFAARIDLAAGTSSQNLEVGDIDNDGRLDIITASDGSSQVSVYRNTSTPGTISIQPRVSFATGGGGVGVSVGDLDGDGRADLIVVRAAGFITVFRSTSSPGSLSFAAAQNFAVGANPYSVGVADIDGDGLVDIAASNRGSNTITVYRNASTPGTITFDAPATLSTGAGSQPHGVALGDLDGDGKPDIASCNYSNRTVSVFRNNSAAGSITAASFDTRVDFSNGATGNPTYLSFGDVNADGKPEILVGNDNGTLMQVHENTSTPGTIVAGSFASKVDFTTGTRPYNVISGDIDADGKPDLVAANATSNTISVLRNNLLLLCIPAAQRNALIALYNSTDGANWTNDTNWLSADVATWNGVVTTGCDVTELNLQFNNLVGTLPPEIGDLTALTTLRVSSNQLSGVLPNEITNLTNLEYLFINNNNLTGPLPATIGNMTSLLSIDTQLNGFTGPIPASLANCTELRNLHLEGNQHTGSIPSFLGTSNINLQSINLGFNQFDGIIPPELGNLTGLSFLSLAENDLFGVIPAELGDLDQLLLLDLSRNQLFGNIPIELGNCTNLNSLLLWDNQLTGGIPQELDNLTNLMELNLSQNFLNGNIPGWTVLPNLGYVNFSNNLLDGDLPSSLGTHLAIQELYLNNNFLTDDIPQEIADLPALRIIDVSHNLFDEMRAFSSSALTDLNVAHNSLDFGDLELNLGVTNYSYDPQALLPPGGIISFTPGGTLTIPFTTPGTANQYEWYVDGSPVAGGTSATLVKPGMTLADAGFYYVYVTSTLATGTTLISRNYVVISDPCGPGGPEGDNDPSFTPDIGGADVGGPRGVGLQSTGKIIIAAAGNTYGVSSVDGIFRLNSDGTFDNTFNVYTDFSPGTIQVQPDDKILALWGGYTLVRLNSDGTEDAAFNSNLPSFYNASYHGFGLQPDGKIVVVVSEDSNPAQLHRLNADGTLDPSFTGPTLDVSTIRFQTDGKIIVAGYGGGPKRLNSNGSMDFSFIEDGANGFVSDVAIQPDGKIIIVGDFTSYVGVPKYKLARLNTDGSLDASFAALGVTDLLEGGTYPRRVLLQSDNKIILVGDFEKVNGTIRNDIARLNTDGTVDCSFDSQTGTDGPILDAVIQPDGNIVIVGDFDGYNGAVRDQFARVLNGSSSPNNSIKFNGSNQDAGLGTWFNYQNFTISMWVKPGSTQVAYANIIDNNHTGVRSWAFQQDFTTLNRYAWRSAQVDLAANVWQHITLTTNAGVSSIYLNGCLVSSSTGPLYNYDGTQFLRLGRWGGGGRHWNGEMDEVKIYDRALSDSEILADAYAEIPPTTPNLIAYYKMDETGGATAFDATANNRDATLINGPTFQLTGVPSLPTLPTISSFAPSSGPVGTLVTVTGTNFETNPSRISVTIGGIAATITSNTATSLTFFVPPGFTSGKIRVTSMCNPVESVTDFTATAAPNNSIKFNGTDQESQLGTWFNYQNFTVSMWLKPGSTQRDYADIIDNNHTALRSWVFQQDFNNVNRYEFRSVQVTLTANVWQHVTLTSNNGTCSIYLNGCLVGTATVALINYDGTQSLKLGDWHLQVIDPWPNRSWNGEMDEVKMYDRVLTDAEILADVFTEIAPTTPNLLAYYKMNEVGGLVSYDATAAARNGTLINSPTFQLANLPPPTLPPTITSFTPPAAGIGTPVTITGTGFSPTFANNIVLFNGVPAVVTGGTTTSISTSVPAGATTGLITVTVGCFSPAASPTPFTVLALSIDTQPADATVCEGATAQFTTAASGTTNIIYQWQFSVDGVAPFTDIVNGGGYSNATTAILSVNTTGTFGAGRYRCRINGDLVPEVITNDEGLFINPLPSPPGGSGNSGCQLTSILLSASGGVNGQYRWYTLATGGTAIAGEVNDTYATPALSATTTFFVALHNGTCESTRTPVVATTITLPVAPTVIPATGCAPSASVTLTAAGGSAGEYRWYTVATGGTPIVGETSSTYITPVLLSSTTYFVSIHNGTCESLRTSVLANIQSCTPTIAPATATIGAGGVESVDIAPLVSTVVAALDLNSIKVIIQPSSGAVASVSAGVLTIDYSGVPFVGTETLTIEACDLAGYCAQQVITIEVAGDITVYNAVSPNGDGKNDFFLIQYIDAMPATQQNKVTILNRWGTVVFEATNYDNANTVFRGLSNGGDELPSGTYYYVLEFPNGAEKRTGFLSLRR